MSMEAAGARDVIVNYCRKRMRTPTVPIGRYCELLNQSIARALRESPGDEELMELREPGEVIARANNQLAVALDRMDEGVSDKDDEAEVLDQLRSTLRNAINNVRNAAEYLKECADDIPGGRRIARDAADLIEESDRAEEIVRTVDPRNPVADNAMVMLRVLRSSTQMLDQDADERIGRGRVLVVDSDPSTGYLMQRLVERFDCECLLVETGAEALRRIARGRIDLIITELMLSDMMAFDILRRLQDEKNETPVIVASNIENENYMVACIALGARDYLPNPPPTMLLKARMKPALEQKLLADRSRHLLYSILPEHIAKEWPNRGRRMFADRHDVAVLFTDIVGFTKMMRDKAPDNVILFLNDVFLEVDGIIKKRRVQKIKTIGDAYMICSGLSDGDLTPEEKTSRLADVALELAVDLGERMKGLCELAGFPPLQLRVGMHYGPVVAGVIGQERPAYDIWGDSVNVAARMESHGAPGRVHVSGEVQEILADSFEFEAREPIEVKSLGETRTFFLNGRRAD